MALIDEVRLLMPWMPEGMVQAYVEGYTEYGERDLAWAYVRQSENYDRWVPGNRRDDGSLRMSERQYFSTMDAYANAVLSVGIDPNLFQSRGSFVQLIEGEVSPDEFGARVDAVYERVLTSAPEVQEEYSRFWDVPMTAHAMVASLMDPEVGDLILNRQITMAEVSAEGVQSGFRDLTRRYVRGLVQEGLDAAAAEDFFSAARTELPVLSALASRHADPDDEFDLEEFTMAMVLDDPYQRRRIRRLVAQEEALFSMPTAQTQYAQIGGQGQRLLTGLGDV